MQVCVPHPRPTYKVCVCDRDTLCFVCACNSSVHRPIAYTETSDDSVEVLAPSDEITSSAPSNGEDR